LVDRASEFIPRPLANQEHFVPDADRAALGPLVEKLLWATLYWLSPEGRRLVSTLVARNGRLGPMHRLTAALGVRNRHQLTRLLARENLPPLESLAAWIRVLLWVIAWEKHGTPLARARGHGYEDPALRFRTIRRVADCTWTELQSRGSAWALLELHNRCVSRAELRSGARRSA
jgi:hypothetical protein